MSDFGLLVPCGKYGAGGKRWACHKKLEGDDYDPNAFGGIIETSSYCYVFVAPKDRVHELLRCTINELKEIVKNDFSVKGKWAQNFASAKDQSRLLYSLGCRS